MALDEHDRERLADDLYDALRRADPIEPLTASHDLTIEDAYEIQSVFVDRRIDDGATVVGHKVGLTSEGIQDQLGVDEPDFGHLLDTMAVSGRTVPTEDLVAPRIEPELGFVLAEDLVPPVDHIDVLAATRGVVPVVEIIDSRVRDWDIEIQDTVADNASAGLYVVGEQLADVSDRDFSLEGGKLLKNGHVVDAGVGANVLGHPARAVAWLANTLDGVGETLSAGELVLSGSYIPAADIVAGDTVTVEFASVGSLTLSVV